MEPKARSTSNSVPTQLDAVAWVRSIRDAMYERTKTMSREDFAAYIARVARAAATERGEGAENSGVHGTG
jgi:hypothetical protein